MKTWMISLWAWIVRRWKRFRFVLPLQGDTYLVRYRLINTRWFGVYIHHILRSDADRELHDHPFDFGSLILWGWYIEHREVGGRRFKTCRHWLSWGWRKAEQLHRLQLGRPVWTLVLRLRKRRKWGFQTEQGWVEYEDFYRLKGYELPEKA